MSEIFLVYQMTDGETARTTPSSAPNRKLAGKKRLRVLEVAYCNSGNSHAPAASRMYLNVAIARSPSAATVNAT